MHTVHYILFAMSLLSLEGKSQSISFVNRSAVTLDIAIATYEDSGPRALLEIEPRSAKSFQSLPRSNKDKYWKTMGWYQLKPNTEITVGHHCVPSATVEGVKWLGYYIEPSKRWSLNISSKIEMCESVIAATGGYEGLQFEKYLQVEGDTDFVINKADANQYALQATFQSFQIFIVPEGWKLEITIW